MTSQASPVSPAAEATAGLYAVLTIALTGAPWPPAGSATALRRLQSVSMSVTVSGAYRPLSSDGLPRRLRDAALSRPCYPSGADCPCRPSRRWQPSRPCTRLARRRSTKRSRHCRCHPPDTRRATRRESCSGFVNAVLMFSERRRRRNELYPGLRRVTRRLRSGPSGRLVEGDVADSVWLLACAPPVFHG
jgi:hypothetical protein